jgi:RNA polymerase-binding transcription factor DksA
MSKNINQNEGKSITNRLKRNQRIQDLSQQTRVTNSRNCDSGSSGDSVDQAQELMEMYNAIALDICILKRHRQLHRAQQRQLEGLAGICEDCNKVIPSDRLKVLPNTTRCISCQRSYEMFQDR